jgi:Flp pilus assembly pilin Flp
MTSAEGTPTGHGGRVARGRPAARAVAPIAGRLGSGLDPPATLNQFTRKIAGVAALAPSARVARCNLSRDKGVCECMFERLWRDQRGASLIDYAILAALITVLVAVGVAVAGAWAQGMWSQLLPRLG